MDDDEPRETTGLLPRSEHPQQIDRQPPSPSLSPLQCILAAATVQLLLNITSHLELVPQTYLLEQIVCKNYYSNINSDNGAAAPSVPDKCKIEAVQSETAWILGWEQAIEQIAPMLLVVPFGALADRFGRKKILLVAIVGITLNDVWVRIIYWFADIFPVRMVLLAGLWQVIGAGTATLSSLTYAIVADACPPEQRTTAFSQLRSAQLISQFIFVPGGGLLTEVNPWIPMFIASAFMIFGLLAAILLIPETNFSSEEAAGMAEHTETSSLLPRETQSAAAKMPFDISLANLAASTRQLGSWIVQHRRLVPVVLSFFVFQVGEQSGFTLLLQYASKRLGWSYGRASYLLSIRAGIHIIVLAILIPTVSLLLQRCLHLPATTKDKRIAQASGVFLVLGSGAIFLATSPPAMVLGQVLNSVGDVFSLPARSLATSMVEPGHLGALFTVIQVMTQAGLLLGLPLLAGAYRWGMEMGQFWTGLPFLVAAGCFLVALLAVSTAPVPSTASLVILPHNGLPQFGQGLLWASNASSDGSVKSISTSGDSSEDTSEDTSSDSS